MRLFTTMLVATMLALFMGIVVAYQAWSYGYVTGYILTMLPLFAFLFGAGVIWCLDRFQDLEKPKRHRMATPILDKIAKLGDE